MADLKNKGIVVKKQSTFVAATKLVIKKFINTGGKKGEIELGVSQKSTNLNLKKQKISLEHLEDRKLYYSSSLNYSPSKPIVINTMIENDKYDNFGIKKVYKDKKAFENAVNIAPFKDLRKKYNLGKANAEERIIFETCRDFSLVFGVTKDVFKEENDATFYSADEKEIIEEGGKLIVATSRPTMALSKLNYDEIVLITTDVLSAYWGIDSLSYFNSKDLEGDYRKKVMFLLNYMEKGDISDLHMAQADDESYFLGARRHTKIIDVKDEDGSEVRYNVSKAKNTANMLLQMGGGDTESTDLAKNIVLTADTIKGRRNFRLNILSTLNNNERGFSFSLRRLPKDEEIKSLEKLNYMRIAINLLIYMVSHNKGLITISGKTNSGKSTLGAALVKILRDDFEGSKIIVRVGSPIEINLDKTIMVDSTHYGQNEQDEINDDNSANKYILKNIKRHDPDVVCIEETRSDNERRVAVECATSGWLTILTTHAGTAEECVSDFLKIVDKTTLNSIYLGNVSKSMILKPCKKCKDKDNNEKKSCEVCGGSGTSGVLPVYDLIVYVNVGLEDDLMNTDKLVEENKALRISKADCITYYENKGLINKNQEVIYVSDIGDGSDFDINELMNSFPDLLDKNINAEIHKDLKNDEKKSDFASADFISTVDEKDDVVSKDLPSKDGGEGAA